MLSGPPGVGKTTTALALALENGWNLVEMNASDARNERAIEEVAGRASITHTLEGSLRGGLRNRALILLDEADCLTGRKTDSARPAPPPASLREFLRGRYGKIEELNTAWGLGATGRPPAFSEWEDLPKTAGRAVWTRLGPAQRDLADWKGHARPKDLTDRGGLGAIAKLVRTTRQPLVLTVNDESVLTRYSPVFRTSVLRLAFGRLRDADVAAQVSRVAARESITLGPGSIEAIVKKARGDLRAALNDLEAVAPLPPGPAQLTVLGVRDLTSDLEALTAESLTAHRFYRSGEVRDRIDAPPDDLFPWVEENLPASAPDAAHLEAAFQTLAVADLCLQRARRARVWSLWSFASELMTGGVGLVIRDAPVPPRERVYFPEFLGRMGGSRNVRGIREAVVVKVAHRLHLSKAKARSMVLPFVESVVLAGTEPKGRPELRETARRLVAELALGSDEIAYLVRAEPESSIVRALAEPDDDEGLGRPATEEPPLSESSSPEPSLEAATSAPPKKRQRSLSEFGG